MADVPLVSVMIAVYNGAPYLPEALESVLHQTYEAVEVLVIDDGSTDGSGDIARSYDAVRCFSQPRAGIGASRNRAVELAQGAFFSFLDADDWMQPQTIETLIRPLAVDPDLEAVFAHVHEFISPDLPDDARGRMRMPADRIAGRLPTTMLARRESFLRVGLFPTNLRRGVTLDWSARALELGLKTIVLDDVLFERRLHADNNGLRERESTNHYARVLKAALDRRRAAGTPPPSD